MNNLLLTNDYNIIIMVKNDDLMRYAYPLLSGLFGFLATIIGSYCFKVTN